MDLFSQAQPVPKVAFRQGILAHLLVNAAQSHEVQGLSAPVAHLLMDLQRLFEVFHSQRVSPEQGMYLTDVRGEHGLSFEITLLAKDGQGLFIILQGFLMSARYAFHTSEVVQGNGFAF